MRGFFVCGGYPLPAILAPNRNATLITGSEAASFLGVSAATIRKWNERGIITAAGLNEQGHNMYRLGDIVLASRPENRRK